MNKWISQSNYGQQIALIVGCIIIGLLLAIGFRHFHGPGMTNALAGFLLGVLLLGIGLAALLLTGKQTVTVDPTTRGITVEETSLCRAMRRTIPFADIVDIHIRYMGKRSNYVNYYYLVLKLSNGEEYPLFTAGYFYEGAADRSVVESWRQRVQEYLRG